MNNPYIPKPALVEEIFDEAPLIKTFKIKTLSDSIEFTPGQFVMIYVPGIGESPFAISSSPFNKEYIKVSVRAVGDVTKALHRLSPKSLIGVRGPLGNGFPIDKFTGKDVVIIAGGTGLFGVTSLLWYIYEKRSDFNDVKILYGARTPRDIVRKRELDKWSDRIEVLLTVDRGDETWRGNVGVVTTLLDKVKINYPNTLFVVCGPPLMLKATYSRLLSEGAKRENIYVSLERHMKCGIGKCGRCMLSNGLYVCKDGPVFTCNQLPERDIE